MLYMHKPTCTFHHYLVSALCWERNPIHETMDRPEDATLATFVKNGAYYYTVRDHDASRLFGVKNDEALTRYFSPEMIEQQIGETVVVRYKPSSMELSVSGYGEWPALGW
jgi:hypothetical protein